MVVYEEFIAGNFDAIEDQPWCSESSPNNRFVCTRTKGHDGLHYAGIDLSHAVARWDDNRSTDEVVKSDFFAEIGL